MPSVIIIGRIAVLARCHIAGDGVASSVGQSVCCDRETRKSGGTDRDAVRYVDSGGPIKEPTMY